jgi:hypothetical protein
MIDPPSWTSTVELGQARTYIRAAASVRGAIAVDPAIEMEPGTHTRVVAAVDEPAAEATGVAALPVATGVAVLEGPMPAPGPQPAAKSRAQQ